VRRKLPSPGIHRGSRYVKRNSGRTRTSKVRKSVSLSLTSLRSALRLVAIVILLSALLVGYRVYTYRIWKGSDRITFALQVVRPSSSNEVYVVSYLSSKEKLAVVSFPEGMKIEAVGGFGSWRIESLYPLGEMEDKGGELLQRSLSEFFGVSVDGWVVTDSVDSKIDESNVRKVLRQIFGFSLIGKSKTNFGIWDLVRLWKAVSTVQLHNLKWVNLKNAGAVSEETLPDGSRSYIADLELLNQLSQDLFSYPEIVEEELTIAVLNATDHRGLGADVARIIRNIGGEVVTVSDSSRKQDKLSIITADEEVLKSLTAKSLAKTFLIERILIGDTSQQRADILVVVGEDYWEWLTRL
jgi:hypothetical protein